MSIISRRPASHPYQRRAARNVRRASSSPESTVTRWPMISSTRCRILLPFGASCIADVASASSCETLYCSASRIASSTAASSASTACFLMLPSSLRWSMSRTVVFELASGSGRAPTAASTTSMCTVFDPMSSTPKRVDCSFRFATGVPLMWLFFSPAACRRAHARRRRAASILRVGRGVRPRTTGARACRRSPRRSRRPG